jgi:hypothetical protein
MATDAPTHPTSHELNPRHALSKWSRPVQAVQKPLFFAGRIALTGAEIRFGLVTGRVAGSELSRRLSWRVGKARSGSRCALLGAHSSIPMGVMYRRCIGSAAQGDQKAHSQNRTHRFSPDVAASLAGARRQRANRSRLHDGSHSRDHGAVVRFGKDAWRHHQMFAYVPVACLEQTRLPPAKSAP